MRLTTQIMTYKKTHMTLSAETFGLYTDSILGKKCAQTINAWEKSSGLMFTDL
jgi:hypothetical protein